MKKCQPLCQLKSVFPLSLFVLVAVLALGCQRSSESESMTQVIAERSPAVQAANERGSAIPDSSRLNNSASGQTHANSEIATVSHVVTSRANNDASCKYLREYREIMHKMFKEEQLFNRAYIAGADNRGLAAARRYGREAARYQHVSREQADALGALDREGVHPRVLEHVELERMMLLHISNGFKELNAYLDEARRNVEPRRVRELLDAADAAHFNGFASTMGMRAVMLAALARSGSDLGEDPASISGAKSAVAIDTASLKFTKEIIRKMEGENGDLHNRFQGLLVEANSLLKSRDMDDVRLSIEKLNEAIELRKQSVSLVREIPSPGDDVHPFVRHCAAEHKKNVEASVTLLQSLVKARERFVDEPTQENIRYHNQIDHQAAQVMELEKVWGVDIAMLHEYLETGMVLASTEDIFDAFIELDEIGFH